MRVIGLIPARMAATRFPNKPMAKIEGIPMIGHCYLRTRMCDLLDEVYVASCDQVVIDYITSIGGRAVMTSDVHERATERCAEALLNIEKDKAVEPFDIVVMIQGDEPLIDPRMIGEVLKPMMDGKRMVSNLMAFLETQEERENPNNVKVVTRLNGDALYMSREPIPSKQKYSKPIQAFRQLGLIAYTREALLKFVSLPTSPLEIIESVDMNRFLEHGIPIYMSSTKHQADSVDIPEDLARVTGKMRNDSLFQTYKDKIQ